MRGMTLIMELHDKFCRLKADIKEMKSIAVAFSGGTDSTLLLKVAHDILNDNAIAITVQSSVLSERELSGAVGIADKLGIKHVIIELNEMDIEGFSDNPVNRCYICKKEVFTRIIQVARQQGIAYVVDGSNVDDLSDYRPGMLALQELGVKSPLRGAGMTKSDIRVLSKEIGLPTWDKPAFACLASRFPYGERITKEKLERVDRGEQYLLDIGFRQVRVRYHGDIARIEVSENERSRFYDEKMMDMVYNEFKKFGFKYTALDLKGYRTGSMNEELLQKKGGVIDK